MRKSVKRLTMAGLTALMVGGTLTVGTTSASAIDETVCKPEFLQITLHRNGTVDETRCFANGGEWYINFPDWWITKISTGNNRVQWYGDGSWQPSAPIEKYTVFTWPNHPGGVRFDGVRIV